MAGAEEDRGGNWRIRRRWQREGQPGAWLEGLNGTLQQIRKTLAQVQVFMNALSGSSAGKTNLYDMIGAKLGTAMAFISAYEKSSQILGNKGAGRSEADSQDMPANGPAATRNERAA